MAPSWADFCAQNASGVAGAAEFAQELLARGASASARTRDGLPASMVVGEGVGGRTKRQQAADDDMREMLRGAEADEGGG